jgi:hypothetical protein
MYGASDYAVTEGKGDYTEHGVAGVDGNLNVYIADWWRGQTASDVWIERKCDLIVKHKPSCWFGEAGPIRRAVEPFLMRRMRTDRRFAALSGYQASQTSRHGPGRFRAWRRWAKSGYRKTHRGRLTS